MKDGIKCLICGLVLAFAFVVGVRIYDWFKDYIPSVVASIYLNDGREDTYSVPVNYNSEPIDFLMSSPYQAIPRTTYIEIVEPVGNIYLEDRLTFKAVVNGFEGTNYKIKWQYRKRGQSDFKDIEGSVGPFFYLYLTEETRNNEYRFVLTQ